MSGWLADVPTTDELNTWQSRVFKEVAPFTYVCLLCSSSSSSSTSPHAADWSPPPAERIIESGPRFGGIGDGPQFGGGGVPMIIRQRQAHACDPLHVQRANALLEQRKQAMDRMYWSLEFGDTVKYYCCRAFEAELCRHILFGNETSQAAVSRHQKVLRLSDPLVHLELALWKAACELSPPVPFGHSLEWKAWYRAGWKDLKAQMRRDPLTSVTALIAPFLGLKRKEGASEAAA
jgi:hypothetical protein